jgi:chitin disaccharide deacetylase
MSTQLKAMRQNSPAASIKGIFASLALLLLALPAGAEISGRVFLTFDDGPIDVSLDVLDVLKAQNIKATFFVNAIHLEGRGGENEGRATHALRRIVAEGHVIGNHSHDHMGHNRPPGVYSIGAAQAYRDVGTDLPYFFPDNVTPINQALGSLATRHNNQITSLARLPFSNVWMFEKLGDVCGWCGVDSGPFWHPDARANARRDVSDVGGQLAAALHQQYKVDSIGWDVQWEPSNWTLPNTNETLPPAMAIEQEIVSLIKHGQYCVQVPSGVRCKAPVRSNSVVLLMHDFLFENGVRGQGKDVNLPQLIKLIESLKARGYRFDTLDHYRD